MSLSTPLSIAVAAFPISEVALAVSRRASRRSSGGHDRGSLWILWVVITASVVGAFWVRQLPIGRIGLPSAALDAVALVILLGGIAFRWAAILTLGKYFTVDVAIAADHRIVQEGAYRVIRHPSYTGLLVAFLGMGLALRSWLSVAALLLPISIALAVRIAVEERALRAAFGGEYEAYRARTWRMIPWVV